MNTENKTELKASAGREASECSELLSSACDYIDALEKRLAVDSCNPWSRIDNPTNSELASKKAKWLANKSVEDIKGR